MRTRIRLEEFSVEEKQWDSGKISFEVPNADMMPTMRDFYDTVTITKPHGKLNKNDVVLYCDEENKLTLSRIAYVNKDTYSISPDGKLETKYNITDSQIVGVMESFDRKDKTIKADNKYYLYYVSALPVVKTVYCFYLSLKLKLQDFIKFLFKR